jgi:NADPH:quinone reductase-like Zn-dependent oxidoreductase
VRAIRVDEHGGPEVLRIVQIGRPEPGPGEVRVRVTHCALNHLDVWVRRGIDGHRFPLPLIPCADIVGIREDTGEAVALHPAVSCMRCPQCLAGRHDLCRKYLIRGERMDGGCCEDVVVPQWQLLGLGGLAPEEAVALPLALLTAWHMLERAGVSASDRVLVQGGAGGVASLAIQLARYRGARVVATASTEAKRALCRGLGAEEAWPYDEVVSGVKAWTGRAGVDVVIEHVGAATWTDSVRCARWGGTVVTCGATTGHQVALDLRVLFFKQLNLLGSTMGSIGELTTVWKLATSGQIRPVIDRVMPMSEIGEAQRRIEAREVLGKIVLRQDLGS